jgi:glycine/sarcosine N-methyltransferase
VAEVLRGLAPGKRTAYKWGVEMSGSVECFYDDLAEYYHLIFEDWDRSIARQASILGPLLERYAGKMTPKVLDCACGIGTQALGLAQRGHVVMASDLSRAAVERGCHEAQKRGLTIEFYVADMKNLDAVPATDVDVVLAADNALPHMVSQEELTTALREIAGKLRDGGVFVATVRDYDNLLASRPTMQAPAFYEGRDGERIVHQVWHWHENRYQVHLYLTLKSGGGWIVKHFSALYRALLRSELNDALQMAGFSELQWLETSETSFYQPIVVARKMQN